MTVRQVFMEHIDLMATLGGEGQQFRARGALAAARTRSFGGNASCLNFRLNMT